MCHPVHCHKKHFVKAILNRRFVVQVPLNKCQMSFALSFETHRDHTEMTSASGRGTRKEDEGCVIYILKISTKCGQGGVNFEDVI